MRKIPQNFKFHFKYSQSYLSTLFFLRVTPVFHSRVKGRVSCTIIRFGLYDLRIITMCGLVLNNTHLEEALRNFKAIYAELYSVSCDFTKRQGSIL